MTTTALTREQTQIQKASKRFLQREYPSARIRLDYESGTRFEAADWARIVSLEWPSLCLEERHGGAGYGVVERCLLMEEMGRALMPGPNLSSAVIASDLLALAGGEGEAARLLAELGAGKTLATVLAGGDLLSSPDLGGAVVATCEDGAHRLDGASGIVLDAHAADVLVAIARIEGAELGIFVVPAHAAGLTRTPVSLIDGTRGAARVELRDVTAQRIDAGDAAGIARVALDRARVALAAEMVGGAQACLEMIVEYARLREQFGVPIGSFQAIKHRCANLYVLVEAAREAVQSAAEVADGAETEPLVACAAAAKLAASDAFVLAASEAIQLHGGIGFTWDHDAHLYFRRAKVDAQLLGSRADELTRLADALDV